ncbi:MAG: hypothetical protein V9G98_02100 [Candidatus Competibacter sp.]
MKSLNKISPVWLFCYSVLTVSTTLADVLENPQPGSAQSGISLISGWVCNASHVYVVIDGSQTYTMAYGTERTDTLSVCGDTNNGFGFLFNYNKLGDGQHTLQALADGVEFGQATFTVTTLGQEYLEGASRTFELPDFPNPGTTLTLTWQEHLQNFTIAGKKSSGAVLASGSWSGENVCFNVSPDGSKLTKEGSLCTGIGNPPGTTINQGSNPASAVVHYADGSSTYSLTDIPIVNNTFDDGNFVKGIFTSSTTASGTGRIYKSDNVINWNARKSEEIKPTSGKWFGRTSVGGTVCFYVSSDGSKLIKPPVIDVQNNCFCSFTHGVSPGKPLCPSGDELQIVNNFFWGLFVVTGKFDSNRNALGTTRDFNGNPVLWTANPNY